VSENRGIGTGWRGWIPVMVLVSLGSGDALAGRLPLGADREVAALVAAPTEGGMESGIRVYPRAENVVSVAPTPAELRRLLETSSQADLRALRGLRAVVFRVPGPVTAAEIMRWYGTPPQGWTARPLGAGGAPAQPVAGPRNGMSASQIGFRALANEPGYLVVSVAPSAGRPQDLQVTVARVEGSTGVVKLLEEVPAIVGRAAGGRTADVATFAFPGSEVERDINLPGTDAPQLLQQIAALNLPANVRKIYADILGNARSISLTTYLRQATISPEAFFAFYRESAGRWAWGEVMKDASNPQRPMIIFSVGQGGGVAMVRAEVTPMLIPIGPGRPSRTATGTRITLLLVEGEVDLRAVREAQP
jgi:hypothetical protein